MKKNGQKKAKNPNDYPRLSVRISVDLLARIKTVKENAGLSDGQIVSQALRRYMPELEKFHKVSIATN